MAKQIYNYEIFTSKKEELEKIREKRAREKRIKIIVALVLFFGMAFVGYILFNSRSDYYIYQKEEEIEDNAGASYEAFESGYLKYTNNGIEYQEPFGRSKWNVSISYAHPFLVTSDSYAVLGDKGENSLVLFDRKGKVKELVFKYPLVQATVSAQGITEVILEGEGSNYIQVYGKNGKMIADMKSSVDETGYPVTAAISPDGTQLAVSFYSINAAETRTSVVFYDLSRQLQSDDVTLKGGFDYKDTLIPKISFMNDSTVAVFGNTATYFYNIKDEPRKKKEIHFEQEIQSIFENDKYVGYVMDNTQKPEDGKYEIMLFNRKGNRMLDCKLDMNYDFIKMWGNHIIATRDNECTIINKRGNILFQGKIEGDKIESVLPVRGWRTYQIVFRDRIVKMKLRFWKTGSRTKKAEQTIY